MPLILLSCYLTSFNSHNFDFITHNYQLKTYNSGVLLLAILMQFKCNLAKAERNLVAESQMKLYIFQNDY